MKCSKCEVNNENVIVTIKDKNKEVPFCMNCLVECCINRKFNFENDENLIDDVTGEKGAIQYISKEVTYVLEKKTMIRLILNNLDPDEYFALAKKYGADKFELHSDFYDEFDGVAIQPIECY